MNLCRRFSWICLSLLTLSACGDERSAGNGNPNSNSTDDDDDASSGDDDDDDDDDDDGDDDDDDGSSVADDDDDDDSGSSGDDDDDDSGDDDDDDDDGADDDDDDDETPSSDDDDDDDNDDDDDDVGDGELVTDLSIDRVEVNQGIAVDLWAAGAETGAADRRAPLVKNRPMLVRAYWKRESDFKSREIEGQLLIEQPDGSSEVLSNKVKVDGDPDLNEFGKTFSWILEPAQVQAGTKYAISLVEPGSGNAQRRAIRVKARVPAEGTLDVGIPENDMHVTIVVVPMVYNGKAPDTSEKTIESIRTNMYRYNALESDGVTISVREAIEVMEDNLDHMLDRVTETRMQDSPADHVYYEGVCDSSVAGGGLAWVAGLGSWAADHRAGASGIGSNGTWVVVHETGHNQGMAHNPGCGAAGANPDWPYPDSLIVHQGWDVSDQTKLYSGMETNDYMSYCHPNWLSDFSYRNSGETITELTKMEYAPWERLTPARKGPVLHGLISKDGRATWSIYPSTMPGNPTSPSAKITVDRSDGARSTIDPVEFEIGHELTRALLVPLPDELDTLRGARVKLEDGREFEVPLARARTRYFDLLARRGH